MKKLTIGAYDIECPACETLMMTLRVGRMDKVTKIANVHARCESCKHTNRVNVKLEFRFDEKYEAFSKKLSKDPIAPAVPARPTAPTKNYVKRVKKKRVGPVKRTYAGLKGTRESKREWTFKYPTDEYGPLWLKTTKNTWNNWSVWWAAERVASGDTIKEALEKAKKRLTDRGYILTEGKS